MKLESPPRSAAAKRGPDPWSVTLVVFVIWVVVLVLIGGDR